VTTQVEGTHLFEAARRGDRRARERLVAEHLSAVRSIALRYRNLGLSLDDLMQEGSLGLLEAIDRYEAERGSDFESYARFRIRRAIRNALTEQSRLIRLPKQIVERRRAIERAEASLKSATGRTPSTGELATATGLTPAAVVSARSIGTTPVSLDQSVLEDGSTLEALVSDNSARSPEDETVEHEQAREVDDAVDSLPGRQRLVVSRHFGLGCEPEQIAEVAAELHVSQQRARAIERDALYALRERLEPGVTPRPTR
jgi:RNA polymerase primary sigma factor